MNAVHQPLPERPRLPRTQLFIGGRWRAARDERAFETHDPATESPLASIARGGTADVDDAVHSARTALNAGPWSRLPGSERGRLLYRIAELLERDAARAAALEALDAGKPLAAARRQDVAAAIDCLRYYAGWADKLQGHVVPIRGDVFSYVARGPVGVVGAIVPWNFPLMNAVWKVAPALACGNTVVLKPAELTPLTALLLAEIAGEAGLPPGVLNVVPGFGAEAGQALVDHAGVDKIAFTGSPGVGKAIMARVAQRCARVGLELGGKSPNIVFADADLEDAVRASASGAFFNAGQVCSSGSRILVQDTVYEEFVDRFVRRAQRYRLGDPFDPQTNMGPLISSAQQHRVLGYIEAGVREGASLSCGGGRPERAGHFVMPTVFADVANDMKIAREEIFGPVAAVLRFASAEEALAIANDSPYSLAAAVWTRDAALAHRFSSRLRAGTVWVNTYGHTDTRLPWGGMGGDSGVGRDLGTAALDAYTEQKTVWMKVA